MKNLNLLLKSINFKNSLGELNIPVKKICTNSKKVSSGDIFIAIKGKNVDAHYFVEDAILSGAKAIVCEKLPEKISENVVYLEVENSRKALAVIASNYYDNPSKKLNIIGVTGTSGKTTTVTVLKHIFTKMGHRVGMLSSVKNSIVDIEEDSNLTTLESTDLHYFFYKMVEANCDYCFMEVSSQGIDQYRVFGIDFKLCIFTNISHEHLDYHENMLNYTYAKKKLFDNLSSDAIALANKDDRCANVILQNCNAKKYFFSLKQDADFKAKVISNTFEGLELNIENNNVWTNLIGKFNGYNVLAAYSAATLLGKNSSEILISLSTVDRIPGRIDPIYTKSGALAIIDYAHTPEALKSLLENIIAIKKPHQKLILVVGCGGDRDKKKRPITGAIAANLSDVLILTSDNPRTEDPEKIINEIKEGIEENIFSNKKNILSNVNRAEAIKTAISLSSKDDIIVVVGKGHEKYQIVGDKAIEFDDYTELMKW